MERMEFQECEICAKKPGSPPLCPSCLNNRSLIDKCHTRLQDLALKREQMKPKLAKLITLKGKKQGKYLIKLLEELNQ